MAKKGGDKILSIGIGLNTDPLQADVATAAGMVKQGAETIAGATQAGGEKVTKANQKAGESFVALNRQISASVKDTQEMTAKYGAYSAQAIAAAQKSAQLKDEFGDINTRIAALNPDAPFKAFAGVLQGVAGGFAAAQGAIALFGGESEKVQQMMLKVQAAMALSQGINSIVALKDEFIALNVVMKANPILAVASAVLALGAAIYFLTRKKDENVIATITLTAKEREYIVEINKTTASLKEKIIELNNEYAAKKAGISVDAVVLAQNKERLKALNQEYAGAKVMADIAAKVLTLKPPGYDKAAAEAAIKKHAAVALEMQALKKLIPEMEKMVKVQGDIAKFKPEKMESMFSKGFDMASMAIMLGKLSLYMKLPKISLDYRPEIKIKPTIQFSFPTKFEATEAAKESGKKIGDALTGGLVDAMQAGLIGLGAIIGSALAGGDPFANLSNILLQSIGNLMVSLGEQFIILSSLWAAFQVNIASMNPWAAIGIGVALVAAGTAISSIAAKGMQSPSVGGGSGGSIGSPAPVFSAGGLGGEQITTRLYGTDIIFSGRLANKQIMRIK